MDAGRRLVVHKRTYVRARWCLHSGTGRRRWRPFVGRASADRRRCECSMSTEAPVRIVLVDDHPVVRDGLHALLTSVDDLDVVGQAGSGEEAIDVVTGTRPDVVIMDIEMPGMGGIEATRRLVAADPSCAVLVLTMYDEDEFVFAALRAGARGYLLKGAQQHDVVRTIRAVSRGDAVFG